MNQANHTNHSSDSWPQYEMKDHLGNVRLTYSDRKIYNGGVYPNVSSLTADVRSVSNYYPFGMLQVGRNDGDYRFGFNGKENDNEAKGKGNSLDYGARIYDSRIGRWLSIDMMAGKYPSQSAYNFVLNTPINAVDPDGNDVYFVIWVSGGGDAEDAAKTRIHEIQSSKSYNSSKDHVYYITVTDLGILDEEINKCVNDANKNNFGPTVEASFFGHGAADGPVGVDKTSKYNLSDVTGNLLDNHQLSPSGWKNINFNFDPECSIAAFYGCKTDEFANRFLEYQPVKYSTGVSTSAGGSYSFKGPFNGTIFNLFNRNVYFVGAENGEVMPRPVYSRFGSELYRGMDGQYSYQDDENVSIPLRKESGSIYGNVTIDTDSATPTSGSDQDQ